MTLYNTEVSKVFFHFFVLILNNVLAFLKDLGFFDCDGSADHNEDMLTMNKQKNVTATKKERNIKNHSRYPIF